MRYFLAILVVLFVPWPLLVEPLIRPHLAGQVPADEIPIAAATIAWPLMLVAVVLVICMAVCSKRKRGAPYPAQGTPATTEHHDPQLSDRERRKRRKRAQAGGEIVMALSMLDDRKRS